MSATGIPAMHQGNLQSLWRRRPDRVASRPAAPHRSRSSPRHGRAADRNLIVFRANAGVNSKRRCQAAITIHSDSGYGLAVVSASASALDRDTVLATGTPTPIRSSEQFIEITYQAQLAPWWQVQPDFQYVFNPGAGISDPSDSARRVGDEVVIGVRTNIAF